MRTGVALLFVMAISHVLQAQSTTVSGSIKDESGLALPGVNVMEKGTTNGTTSDADGKYQISVSPNATLVFSFIGYKIQEVLVNGQTIIDRSLSPDITSLEEVVVTGYYSQRKSDVTGSAAVVEVDDAKKTATYDVAKMLQGQVAGVTVQSSGEPGSFVNMKIRGVTSFTENGPLFVIDGILVDGPFDLATSEIESISVLKDATSAAIYGIRGANGVVVITTRKGSNSGKLSVKYHGYTGVQEVTRLMPLTNRQQYQQITNAAYVNAGLPILPGNDPNNALYIDDVDTDWQDAAYRTGKLQSHALTFSGGSQDLNFSMNVDYFKNTGYIESPQSYDRLATALNLGGKTGRFRYGSKIAYSQSDKDNFNEYLPGISSVVHLLQAIPTMPVYDANRLGGYGGADNLSQRAITLNVVGFNNLNSKYNLRNRFIGNIWGEFEIIKGLKYTLRASADRLDYQDENFIPPSDLGWYYITTEAESSLDLSNGSATKTIVDNLLTYERQIGKHKIDAFLGYVMEQANGFRHWSRGVGFGVGEIPHIDYADADEAGQTESVSTRLSYLSRLNYIYDDRYFITGTLRNDKSSVFPSHNNSVNSWSIAGAWKIHNDVQLPTFINTLKIRGGYGSLPNNTIQPYDYLSVVNAFAGYTFNNTLAPGTTVVDLKDPNIRWEIVKTSNVAVEVGLFNRLQFTAEYYVKSSEDLLAEVPLPFSTGSFPANIATNAGRIRNKGFEFTLDYANDSGPFKYRVTGNLSTLKNEVLQIGIVNLPVTGANSRTEVGRSMGELYAYETDGIFQTQAEVDAHADQPNARPGDIRFKDINNDGLINDNDRTFQGVTIPKLTYGINFSGSYKNFDLSFFFQGSAGAKAYNGTYNALMIGGLLNHHTDMLDYWTPDNTDTNVPRPDQLEANANARPSDRFIEKTDYIKLQNIQLGYNLSVNAKYIERARIYVSGQNVWTITGYRGYDPDFFTSRNDGTFSRGYDYGSFPNPRGFLVGVEIVF